MTRPSRLAAGLARVRGLDARAPWLRGASAGLLALAAALLAAWSLRRAEGRLASRFDLVEVVVAGRPVAAGPPLARDDLDVARLPREALPGSALSPDALPALVGRRLLLPLRQGDPLLAPLVEDAAAGGLARDLAPGRRAVAVPVEAASAVAGFIEPGDRVDVVLVWQDAGGESRAATLLEALTVLAVGDRRRAGAAPQDATTAVLDADPRDAEALLVALDRGRLALLLRPEGDLARRPDRRPVTLTPLLPGRRAGAEGRPVEVIRGVR